MADRATYVYRLNVEIPDEYRKWGWEPDGWEGGQIAVDEWETFRWPQRRNYLSGSAARRRAELLRSWGATVTVERSEPVTFVTGHERRDSAAPDNPKPNPAEPPPSKASSGDAA